MPVAEQALCDVRKPLARSHGRKLVRAWGRRCRWRPRVGRGRQRDRYGRVWNGWWDVRHEWRRAAAWGRCRAHGRRWGLVRRWGREDVRRMLSHPKRAHLARGGVGPLELDLAVLPLAQKENRVLRFRGGHLALRHRLPVVREA